MTDSKIADTRNLGAGRWGGANTAAAFLKQFVPNRDYDKDGEQIMGSHGYCGNLLGRQDKFNGQEWSLEFTLEQSII